MSVSRFMDLEAKVFLSSSRIRLEPLTFEHVAQLTDIGLEAGLWKWQPSAIQSRGDMHRYVDAALAQQNDGKSVPFVVIDQETGEIIGSTRFMEISKQHRRVEIGATWLSSKFQRTAANMEMKFLLLSHAFEFWKVIRVVFKTELLNHQSREALVRIGAVEEGIFRKHLLTDCGRARDMVYFSILAEEWPQVKANLLKRIASYRA